MISKKTLSIITVLTNIGYALNCYPHQWDSRRKCLAAPSPKKWPLFLSLTVLSIGAHLGMAVLLIFNVEAHGLGGEERVLCCAMVILLVMAAICQISLLSLSSDYQGFINTWLQLNNKLCKR